VHRPNLTSFEVRLRPLAAVLVALCLVLSLSVSRDALAQSKANEGAARALAKKAMEEDYLNTDFDKAVDKLNQAVAKCGTDKCGVPLRAQLKRDLSAVQSASGHRDQALASMTEAFKIDAGLQLDANFKTKELEAIYAEAKKAAAGSGPSGPPPAGDFTHVPATEQQVRTPIPIYVEYTGSETLKRVMAKYKGLGMTEWKSLELKTVGSGFGANTPCADSQVGDFVYYIQGFNEQNDPVATGGDRNNPYKVTVKTEAVSDPPHLPGEAPPSQCADKGDCPPGLPGCKQGATAPVIDTSLKPEGEACEEDSECQSSECKNQKCTAIPEDTSKPKRKKFWIGVAANFDFNFLGSTSDACLLNAGGTAVVNSAGYYCTQSGADFPARNSAGGLENSKIIPTAGIPGTKVPAGGDSVGGGIIPGDIRILLTLDYAVTANMLVGLHAGYVARSYPGSEAAHFPPIHLEGRYTYVFGNAPIGQAGIHPMIFAGTGAAEYDASVNLTLYEQPNATGCPNAPMGGFCSKTVTAWQTSGPFFLEEAGGARWEFVSGVAGMADLKIVEAIGGSAGFKIVPTPEVAFQIGF
jgi:hypothetical protein